MPSPKVLIVGAGAAGIAAASRLMENNIYNITVLEAEDRIGGRIFTSEFEGGTVELGAQWVHGEVNNVVHSLGSAAALLGDNSYDLYEAMYVRSDGVFMDKLSTSSLFSACKEVMHDRDRLSRYEGSLGDFVNKRLKEQLKHDNVEVDPNTLSSFLEWMMRFQCSIDGADTWYQTSAPGTLKYEECEGNPITPWARGGYANLFKLLMGNKINQIKEKIVFKKKVKRIDWSQQPVKVLCTDGQMFRADHVLLTVSLGVLKDISSELFVPSLPQAKLKAIQGLGIGTVDKIFLKFPHRWWPVYCAGYNFLWDSAELASHPEGGSNWLKEVFGFYSVDNHPLVMCGWVVGVGARLMEEATDQQIKDGCHKLLVRFLGSHFDVPFPVAVIRSQWHSNPHFRGSYSFRSVTSDSYNVSAADLALPLSLPSGHPVVLFGGEATHGHFYSTVHGAVETGWREADRLIPLVSKTTEMLPKASL